MRAVSGARRVKIGGAGHSFTDIACTDGVMLDLSRLNRVLDVAGDEVTVEAGITLRALGEAIADRGLGMENQGDVDRQTVAGASWQVGQTRMSFTARVKRPLNAAI